MISSGLPSTLKISIRMYFPLNEIFFSNSHPSLNIIKCTNKYNQMAARVKETLSTQAVQSCVNQKWFGSGHGGLIPSLWWASCVCERSNRLFKQSDEVNRELLLVRADQRTFWQLRVIRVCGRVLPHLWCWCDSQSFLWSCMCKMLSVIVCYHTSYTAILHLLPDMARKHHDVQHEAVGT